MAIRFIVEGVSVECDSADEAADLIRAITIKRKKTPENHGEIAATNGTAASVPVGSDYHDFWKSINAESKGILSALVSHPDGLTTDELAGQAGIDPQRIKFAQKTFTAAAKRLHIDAVALMDRTRIYVDGKPKSRYSMRPSMRKAITEAM